MNAFIAKDYQTALLESVEKYFDACNAYGSASVAFTATTEALWGRGQAYVPIEGFATGMPYFCLRVPTGGGKTYLAAKCVRRVNEKLLRVEHSVILWLVPSRAIRDQTLKQLRDRESPLYAALAEAGPVAVLDLAETRSLTRATVETQTMVIVATVQAFRREDTEGLKVYESNGALMPHFDHLDDSQRKALLSDESGVTPYSLANVLRLRRPFLIVDEAHNNRTELSFATFAAFRPSGVLELTATPDTQRQPSNVLHSVSAAELKLAQMIKLPILLEAQSDWQNCLAYAADLRSQLHAAADAEQRMGAPYLRPVVLIQAQQRRANIDSLHVHAVRDALIAHHGIVAEQIVIATGEERGLDALAAKYPLGIADPACPVCYVITQQALAEGWDCPSAYILVSLASTQSETAVEQLLGRVLRQPGAKARANPVLNRSYAFVMSDNFSEAASALRDRLVQGAGFERVEAADFVAARTQEQARMDLGRGGGRIVMTAVAVPMNTAPPLKDLAKPLREKLSWDRDAGELLIRAPLSEAETAALVAIVADPSLQATVAQAGEISRTSAVELRLTPSERGERLEVPGLALRIQGELQLFDDPEALEYPFDLSPYDALPNAEDQAALGLADHIAGGGMIDINASGRVQVGFMPDLQRDLGFAYQPENWDTVRLTSWLCRNLLDEGITHTSKWAFVLHWVQSLLKIPGVDLARANRQKFLLRERLSLRISELRKAAAKVAVQRALFAPGAEQGLSVSDAFAVPFDPQGYAPNADYDGRYGSFDFERHYYPRVGDFDSREEFACACWLDQEAQRGRIDFWVRNLVRKPGCSFFLQKADGRFYPDFLCKLPGGEILAVEYKGADRWDGAQDDRDIGGLWEALSEGRCFFVMVRNKDWAALNQMLAAIEQRRA